MMGKGSKILLVAFVFLIVLAVSASYYKFVVLRDFVIEAQVDCDPTSESCFVWECDPGIEDECTGIEEDDTWYYKIAHRNAKNIPLCNTDDETCLPFTCPDEGEAQCDEILCSETTLIKYNLEGACTNPIDFQDDIYTETPAEQDAELEEI
jgi:hypothetical protein